MVAMTSERVPANTADKVNEAIVDELARRIHFYQAHPELIGRRLEELDQEWDIERMIEAEGAITTLTGICMSATLGRKWLVLPLFAQSMMALHAVQGFYPMLPLLRRMGYRTQREIAAERYALKAIQGEFQAVAQGGEGGSRADQAYEASRLSGHRQPVAAK